jgi:hypothetical protein
MDTSVQPWLSMGVRPPYTQTFINENPSWNDDGTIYSAEITLTAKSAFDGINRFYVADAQDLDHFVIPTERSRFNVPVGVAGGKSTGFAAEPGMGRVLLTWEAIDPEEVEDVMGYNVYRYTLNDEGISSDTLRVNPELIVPAEVDTQGLDDDELSFTDYDVVPGTTYYYYYRALRSTLDSTEPSKNVAATPLTAAKGDANGDMEVTIGDVITEVSYLTDQNPKPFIFEAADVNSDEVVNILDVVGTVNLVLKRGARSQSGEALATATYTIEDGLLYIDSPVSLAGLQLMLSPEDDETHYEPLDVLKGMELAACAVNQGNDYQVLAFSMAGRTIAAGHRAVLRVGNAQVRDIVLSDEQGRNIAVAYAEPTVIEQMEQETVNRNHSAYDLQGRKLSSGQISKGVYIINGKKICF